MSNARHTVEQFHGHFANKDWARARELLHDELSFEGPIDRFSRAADYIEAVKRLDAICKRVEARKILVDGNDVCQTISEGEFLREREVVRNEIRGGNRSAEARIPQLTLSAIYPKGHAYGQMVGGGDEQLSTITLRDACEFMQKYYAPERATMVIAGGVVADDAAQAI